MPTGGTCRGDYMLDVTAVVKLNCGLARPALSQFAMRGQAGRARVPLGRAKGGNLHEVSTVIVFGISLTEGRTWSGPIF